MRTGRVYFIADLHLTDERPVATGRFFRFLQEEVAGADALYILGDLFEAWIGDDHDEQVAHDTARRLKSLADSGTPIFFMPGNRDFMLAKAYACRSGMTLIPDPTRINLYGTTTLLMHGDTLCIDDVAYQTFRRRIRHPVMLRLLRHLPRSWRRKMANQARAGSESAKATKSSEIMDVNIEAVERLLRTHHAQRLIHGHTHRAANHIHRLDGQECERWVAPDWYTQWGYVRCDGHGCALKVEDLFAELAAQKSVSNQDE
ncbi:MAG TPA: UDP-2,3-diacylglucosamine diphosphatase [Thiobacillus sp.]|nr:MAG: UDP-2,3-diacylglucosamine diphosphatase [Hydrogenophilales bacterium 16-61-112]HQT70656.1 UDP-2,3-diacylglucosamine diphosphatase [Thiobacillus sp.]